MDYINISVIRIKENILQILAETDDRNEINKNFMILQVSKIVSKAEKCNGILQQFTDPCSEPLHKLTVFSTYMFLSGTDMEEFLKELEDF